MVLAKFFSCMSTNKSFILLADGGDVNKQSEGLRMTPLFLATKWQQADMVRFLLESGADPTLKVGMGHKVCVTVKNK